MADGMLLTACLSERDGETGGLRRLMRSSCELTPDRTMPPLASTMLGDGMAMPSCGWLSRVSTALSWRGEDADASQSSQPQQGTHASPVHCGASAQSVPWISRLPYTQRIPRKGLLGRSLLPATAFKEQHVLSSACSLRVMSATHCAPSNTQEKQPDQHALQALEQVVQACGLPPRSCVVPSAKVGEERARPSVRPPIGARGGADVLAKHRGEVGLARKTQLVTDLCQRETLLDQ